MSGVAERLDRRIEVLTRLIDEGPEAFEDEAGEAIGFTPPGSLTRAREWDDPRLGIERIGDPASFTRDHPRHGSKVREIEKLIRRLPRIGGRARAMSATAEVADLKRRLAAAQDLIVKLTGQLAARTQEAVAERDQRIDTERVLSQLRSRERKADQRRGAKLVLVGNEAVENADVRDAEEEG